MLWGKRSWLDIWLLNFRRVEPACFLQSSQGRGYGAVVVTMLMSQQLLVALNEAARGVGAAFVLGSQLRNHFFLHIFALNIFKSLDLVFEAEVFGVVRIGVTDFSGLVEP